jgi:hypothetical protein
VRGAGLPAVAAQQRRPGVRAARVGALIACLPLRNRQIQYARGAGRHLGIAIDPPVAGSALLGWAPCSFRLKQPITTWIDEVAAATGVNLKTIHQ